jgi:hypothetical protein
VPARQTRGLIQIGQQQVASGTPLRGVIWISECPYQAYPIGVGASTIALEQRPSDEEAQYDHL